MAPLARTGLQRVLLRLGCGEATEPPRRRVDVGLHTGVELFVGDIADVLLVRPFASAVHQEIVASWLEYSVQC